jgi:hypothetical protein
MTGSETRAVTLAAGGRCGRSGEPWVWPSGEHGRDKVPFTERPCIGAAGRASWDRATDVPGRPWTAVSVGHARCSPETARPWSARNPRARRGSGPGFSCSKKTVALSTKGRRLPEENAISRPRCLRPSRGRRVSGGRRLPRRRRGRRAPLQRSPVPGSPSGRSATCRRAALEAPATPTTMAGGVDPA